MAAVGLRSVAGPLLLSISSRFDVIRLCLLISRVGVTGERKDASVEQVGARELKQHTGEILERVRMGERVLITHRGRRSPSSRPSTRKHCDRLWPRRRGVPSRRRWVGSRPARAAFSFWENEDDAVWDEIGDRAAESAEG